MRTLYPKRHSFSVFGLVVGLLLSMIVFFGFILIIWALATSLKNQDSFFSSPLLWDFGYSPAFENYKDAFTEISILVDNGFREANLFDMLGYSFLYAFGCSIAQTLTTATVAYMTSRYPCRFSNLLHIITIITLTLPIVGNTASMLILTHRLNIYNTIWGNWIMKVGFNNIYYLVFYSAFKNIPHDYEEASRIDGASHFKVYSRIMMPMVRPLLLTVALILFIGYWNDYSNPLLYMPNKPTAALGLFHFMMYSGKIVPLQVAGGVLVFLPVFLLFVIFHKRLMGGFGEGGIKG